MGSSRRISSICGSALNEEGLARVGPGPGRIQVLTGLESSSPTRGRARPRSSAPAHPPSRPLPSPGLWRRGHLAVAFSLMHTLWLPLLPQPGTLDSPFTLASVSSGVSMTDALMASVQGPRGGKTSRRARCLMCPELPAGCRPTSALGSHCVLGARGPPLSVITHTLTHTQGLVLSPPLPDLPAFLPHHCLNASSLFSAEGRGFSFSFSQSVPGKYPEE